MITAAALCPSPPLLHPGLTGRDPVVPQLRAACAEATARLLRDGPDVIVVIGSADATGQWDPASRLDPAVFGPALGHSGTCSLPLPLGLGAMLLDQAGYEGKRCLQAVGLDEPARDCVRLGSGLGDAAARTALLVMGDGSARRSLKAPGYLDPRAAAFDAAVEQAVRSGNLDALAGLDPVLACDLMATGRAAWQVLAGGMSAPGSVTDVLYSGDPFGVAYLVAYMRPGLVRPTDSRRAAKPAHVDGADVEFVHIGGIPHFSAVGPPDLRQHAHGHELQLAYQPPRAATSGIQSLSSTSGLAMGHGARSRLWMTAPGSPG